MKLSSERRRSGSLRGFGQFHLLHHVLPQFDGIAHHFKRERVIAHAGNNPQIAFRATGHHDVVVLHAHQCTRTVVVLNLRGFQQDALHSFCPARHSWQHLAQRRCRGVGIDGCAGHIGEQRMKHHMILAAEHENLAFRSAHFLAQRFRKLHRGKSSSDDDYSHRFRFSLVRTTHEPHFRPSVRSLADGFSHFVASLDVVELRLQEQSLGVQFVGSGGLRLRTQGGAFFHLLGDDAAGFGAQS